MWLILKSAVFLTLVYSVFGDILIADRQYPPKKYHVVEKKVNWFEALLTCRSRAMDLATIESQQEQDQLENYLEAIYGRDSLVEDSRWWLGGADLHKDRVFAWFSTGKALNYTNFREGEPSYEYEGNKEHCVELRGYEPWNYNWNDDPCLYQKYFICEYIL